MFDPSFIAFGPCTPFEFVTICTRLLSEISMRACRAASEMRFWTATKAVFWDLVRDDEREDGAVLALLTHKQTGKKLLAASTHLFWNPAFPDVKLAQAELLCKMVGQRLLPVHQVTSQQDGALSHAGSCPLPAFGAL